MFQFDTVAAFISMGGHGFYIWLSYGISVFIMLWLVVSPLRQRKKTLAMVRLQIRRSNAAKET